MQSQRVSRSPGSCTNNLVQCKVHRPRDQSKALGTNERGGAGKEAGQKGVTGGERQRDGSGGGAEQRSHIPTWVVGHSGHGMGTGSEKQCANQAGDKKRTAPSGEASDPPVMAPQIVIP